MKTVKELAETLKVAGETIESWLRLFGDFAPSTVVEGSTVYPDKAVEVLKIIQKLDGEGKSFNEIRTEIGKALSVGPADGVGGIAPPESAVTIEGPGDFKVQAPKSKKPKLKGKRPEPPVSPKGKPPVSPKKKDKVSPPAAKPAAPSKPAESPKAEAPAIPPKPAGWKAPDPPKLDGIPPVIFGPKSGFSSSAETMAPVSMSDLEAPVTKPPAPDAAKKGGAGGSFSSIATAPPAGAAEPAKKDEKPAKQDKPAPKLSEKTSKEEVKPPEPAAPSFSFDAFSTGLDAGAKKEAKPEPSAPKESRELAPSEARTMVGKIGPDVQLSVIDPSVADAFSGIIQWMEVAETERKRTRRLLGLLKSLVLSLLILFLLLLGSVAYLMKLARDEMGTREETVIAQNKMVASVEGYGEDVGNLLMKVDAIKDASERAATAIKEQGDKVDHESKKLDAALQTIRMWSKAESGRITVALDHWTSQQVAGVRSGSLRTAEIGEGRMVEPNVRVVAGLPGEGERVDPSGADMAVAYLSPTAVTGSVYGLGPRTRETLLAAVSEDGRRMQDSRYMGKYDIEGKKEGWGTYLFENGDTYVGDFKSGKKQGRGTYTFRNGDVYIGEYEDDARTGHGTYMYANGDHYVGEFQVGMRNGYGVYTYASGGKYVGQFENGRKHGRGYFVDSSGRRVEGLWDSDSFAGEGL